MGIPGVTALEYIEFGGIEGDDKNWTVTSYDTTRIWGHRHPHAAG